MVCRSINTMYKLCLKIKNWKLIIIIIIDIYIAHIAEASRRLETEGGIEMTWDEEKYIMQNNTNTNIHDINIHRNIKS